MLSLTTTNQQYPTKIHVEQLEIPFRGADPGSLIQVVSAITQPSYINSQWWRPPNEE